MVKPAKTFSIAYRKGGQLSCSWHRVADTYPTKEAADAKAQELAKMGYKANVYETHMLNVVGLPVGWSYDAVQEGDLVHVSYWETRYTKQAA